MLTVKPSKVLPASPEAAQISKVSFLGRALQNAYEVISEAKYHINCELPSTISISKCRTILGELEVAESQLRTIIHALVEK